MKKHLYFGGAKGENCLANEEGKLSNYPLGAMKRQRGMFEKEAGTEQGGSAVE